MRSKEVVIQKLESIRVSGDKGELWNFEAAIILNLITDKQKEIDELKEHIRKRIEYTQDLEKDLFENCENYVVNKNKIRNLKEKYENKCAVLGKHSDNLKWYEMGKIFDKAELCEELLGGQ